MGGNKEGAKKFAERMKKKNPNYFRELNAKSRAAWIANGMRPQGLKTLSPERLREISLKGVAARQAKREAL